MSYRAQDLILLFFVYAFLGWCGEVAFAACKNGRFVNRGFLNGPVCPIYGFGVLIVALALEPWQDNVWMLYVGSAVLTTLLELVTGWALEKLFHTKWWDYSKMPLNIGGYVCLLFSFIWGAACVVILKWVHAPLYALVQRLPRLLSYILCAVFLTAFIVDLAATLVAIRKLSQRLTRLTALAKDMRAISDEMGENIAERTLVAKERYEANRERAEARYEAGRERYEAGKERVEAHRAELERRLAELRAKREALLGERGFGHRRLLEAFPNLNGQHAEAIAHLREAIQNRRKGGK